ncbi:ankyrin repeat, SAM and basic leucine zipper domain-containing protein 1 isoform X3 [Heptranchias perlo]|uniref:ankyrin repeat, SAM and basic leucine zipper domain-containing protein 1 isoform X3 n=1 Tax=Heptranchias perlo TaxID=212740 RepID=UPI00355AC004
MATVRCVAAGAELEDSDDGWYLGCEGYDNLNITPVKTYPVKTVSRDKSSIFELSKNNKVAGTLKEALASQKAQLVEEILNSGVDVETRFGFGWTPLMYAANIANFEITRLLLDRGANAGFVKDQYTVLMAACASSESEEKVVKCVELLLSRNANPNTFSSNRMTPLMYAAREGHTQTITLLVAHGAEINIQDEKGYTALTWASSQGHKSTVLKLIELGTDNTLKTKYGEMAADIAEKNHHSEENDVSFRGLLTMGKEDLEKIGITDPNDQMKILEAVYEMQPEDLQVAQLPTLDTFDCSSEELTKFLIKLKKHSSHLIATVQNVADQLTINSELRVLDLDPDQKSALVCDDLIKCIQDLDKEVERLRNLLLKLQNNQERAPSRMPPSQSYFHHNRFLKNVTIGLFGTGFIFLLIKLSILRN